MERMPALFVGHGSPMNAIEDNEFTRNWEKIATLFTQPKAILSISAHWYTKGSRIMDEDSPRMVYDLYGFPKALYEIAYPSPGAPELALETKNLISKDVIIDNNWGIDHGTWSVLVKMYPNANIPVYQLSIDETASPEIHYQIGEEISKLRDQGVLIIGSGNIVHNLQLYRMYYESDKVVPSNQDFDDYIKENIMKRNYKNVINYKSAGKLAEHAFYTPEHFYPLLYVLGASREEDKLSIFNDSCIEGMSLSMTCYLFNER